MRSEAVLELHEISKKYALYARPADRFTELLAFNRWRRHRDHWALRDVSFAVGRRETLCIIGENGSGKSTLLGIIARVLAPTSGTVEVRGRVAALLELGAGFSPEFTGRENVYLNAAVLGFSRQDVTRKLDNILNFAEIGAYIDQPVRTYSTGMVLRLAFAVAVHLDPEILIVDEALAVGDIYFRQRCMRRIHEMKASGVTIVFVTHEISDVRALGDRALWLSNGRIAQAGDASEVASAYQAWNLEKDARNSPKTLSSASAAVTARYRPSEIIRSLPCVSRRSGSRRAEVLGIDVTDPQGGSIETLSTPARIVVRISVMAHDTIRSPIVGYHLRMKDGVEFSGTNTAREQVDIPAMAPGDTHTIDFHVKLPGLAPEEVLFTPGIADGTLLEYEMCDLVEDALALQVADAGAQVCGYMHIPCASVVVHRTPVYRDL